MTEKTLSKGAQPVVQIEKLDLTSRITDPSMTKTKTEDTAKAVEEKPSQNNNLSVTSSNLIKDLDDAPKKAVTDMNKSANALYDEALPKPRRSRTKSWTTISVEPSHDINFNSDSEILKKDGEKKNNALNTSNISGSGDGIMNTSNKQNEDVNTSVLSDKKNKKRQEKSLVMDTETSAHEGSVLSASPKSKTTEVMSKDKSDSKEGNEEGKSLNTSKQGNGTGKLFQQPPAGLITSLVFIDDSDSNHDSVSKGNTEKDSDSGDQCVPVVVHDLVSNETKEATNNLSYEPMDVDETLPDNIPLSTFAQKNNSVNLDDKQNESQKQNSSLNSSQIKDQSSSNSKRKSSISNVVSDDTLDGNNLPSRGSLEKSSVNDSFTKHSSKRHSAVFNVSTVLELKKCFEGNISKSKIKSLTAEEVKDVIMEEITNKSIRKSSILEDSIKNSSTKSPGALVIDETVKTSPNKYKKRNSITEIVTELEKKKSSNSDSVRDEDVMNKSPNKSIDKSSILNEVNDDSGSKSQSMSKRTSSEVEKHDKSDNENKSTLVLSQIKDLSQNDLNAESNIPKESNDTSAKLCKSVNTPNVTLDKDTDKKNLSLTYLTSTPLQQKPLKKIGMQINSSIITPNSTNKMDKNNSSKNSTKESVMSQNSSDDEEDEEESGEEEESSSENSNLIDNEAEEASDDYESGDSRNEDDKKYEEQNEIVAKGETLDSGDEEEYSDDEYEKDSFIVSSDEEDYDLISGSGDDLDMSDNELSMTSKSKQKYNERKSKEQKRASKEMFEARHQLDDKTGSKTKKNNRQRLDSTTSESDNEVKTQPKKRRQRIDSSQDISNVQSDTDKSLTKKKTPRLKSVSFYEDNIKETSIREDAESEPKSKGRQNESSQKDISNAQSEADKSLSMKRISRRMSVSFIKDDEKEKSIRIVFGTEPRNKKLPNPDYIEPLSDIEFEAENTLPTKKKKMNRRMSVSISKNIETDEEEITICEDTESDKDDPLTLQNVIKTEPKTPQKDLNISTVAVTSVDEAEQVNVEEDVTILESNQSSDPLQTTIAPEDDESECSISENEDITELYENMLNNLNNIAAKKNKYQDISLNLDKKTKQKKNKEPIVDQLNLTQVKKSKKKLTAVDEQPKVENSKDPEKEKPVLVFSEGSTDSIDMKLLFPEDSNDSAAVSINKNEQAKENIQKENNMEVPDVFIPLKRTEGKTNILENTGGYLHYIIHI